VKLIVDRVPDQGPRAVNKAIQKLPKNLAVVVPAYNAGKLVKDVIRDLEPYVHRIILVDDGSTDGCAKGLGSKITRILTIPKNHGKGYALLEGYAKVLEDKTIQCVAVLDADGQHDQKDLPRLHAVFQQENADFLIGARDFTIGYIPLRSRIGNNVTRVVSRFLLGTTLNDTQSGYRLVSRNYLEQVLGNIPGGRYETEMEMLAMAVRGDFVLVSEPIKTIYDEGNTSSHFNVWRDSVLIYRKLFLMWIRKLFGK
jgi:glycosyltransferase involved in cell wall biosynthesis